MMNFLSRVFCSVAIKRTFIRFSSSNEQPAMKVTSLIDLIDPEKQLSNKDRKIKFEILHNKLLRKRVFSEDQTLEKKKLCILVEKEQLLKKNLIVPFEIDEQQWNVLLSEPKRVILNLM